MKCSVLNGSSVIDLSPLIHRTGYYEAFVDEDTTDVSPDFYVNICEPLNPIQDVRCPPGAAVCMVPVNGSPIVSTVPGITECAFPCWFKTASLPSDLI